MLGQVKFAWLDFKRSILVSTFSFFSQIVTFSVITISLGLFSIVRNQLLWSINSIFYRSYIIISSLFIIFSIVIGSIVTIRSIDLKFQSHKDDIGIMKNVGGKSRWIYSYFIFNQIITTLIMLLLGLFVGVISILIVFASFNSISLFQHILFIPIFLGNLSILLVSYLKSHYKIIKFIGEKDFEETSGKLSKYKSIFEFDALINKTKTVSKIAFKNFLRSGKILSSLIFSFFLIFSTVSFILAPSTLANTYLFHVDNRFEQNQYIIGDQSIVEFFNTNLEFRKYENKSLVSEINIFSYFSNFTLNTTFLDSIESQIPSKQSIFLSKLEIKEIRGYEVKSGVYIPVGDNRTFYGTVIGYEEFFIKDNLFIWGEEPVKTQNQVIIGDSLNNELFDNSSIEKLQFQWYEIRPLGLVESNDFALDNQPSVREEEIEQTTFTNQSDTFSISGVITDSFAAGFTVYIPMNQMNEELIASGPNLVIINDLNGIDYNTLKEEAESYGYVISSIKDKIEEFKHDYKNFSNIYNLLSGGLFVIFSFQLIVFGILYYSTYKKDYELLYKLGISKRKIYSMNIISVILQLAPGIILGTYLGAILARYFLIQNPLFSFFSLIIVGEVLWCLILVILGSILATRRSLRKVLT